MASTGRPIANAHPARPWLTARVQRLQAAFDGIARTRMAGLPLLNAALAVEALGFEPLMDEHGPAHKPVDGALGVLLTPWFMNLVWLPPPRAALLAPGCSRVRQLGTERFEFIGAHDDAAGAYELCSLFSPMFEFADQAAARATAWAVLDSLRAPVASVAPVTPVVQGVPGVPGVPVPPVPPMPPRVPAAAAPPRRAFLFGRSAAAGSR